MIRPVVAVWLALTGVAAVVLVQVSAEVRGLEDELSGLNAEIVAERETIRVLRAEWVYVNRPEWLERLADEVTDLAPMRPQQIAQSVAEIPMPSPDPGDGVPLALIDVPGFNMVPVPGRRPALPAGSVRRAPPRSAAAIVVADAPPSARDGGRTLPAVGVAPPVPTTAVAPTPPATAAARPITAPATLVVPRNDADDDPIAELLRRLDSQQTQEVRR